MILKGKAGAPPRTRTYVGQAGTGSKPAQPSVRAWASSERPVRQSSSLVRIRTFKKRPKPLQTERGHRL